MTTFQFRVTPFMLTPCQHDALRWALSGRDRPPGVQLGEWLRLRSGRCSIVHQETMEEIVSLYPDVADAIRDAGEAGNG